jgi:hypothetical protein
MSEGDRVTFFAFGLPKSGTTWLQMLLDAHPSVSCPSEHQLAFLLETLPKLMNDYNLVLREIDRRTAQQGIATLGQQDLMSVTRAFVEACIDSGARRKNARIAGLKDNTIATHFGLFRELFPTARYLCIVRDPRDATISSWHHNLRVEPGFRERVADFSDWAAQTWQRWTETYDTVLAATGGDDEAAGILILRYEDLIGADRSATLQHAFRHIGLALGPADTAALFERTDATRLRAGPGAGFYRSARAEAWRDAPERTEIPAPPSAAQALLKRFRYPVT